MPTTGIDDDFATVASSFAALFSVGLDGGVAGTMVSFALASSFGGFFDGVEGVLVIVIYIL